MQFAVWYRSSHGWSSNQPAAHDSPVPFPVMPGTSSVTQSSCPTVCASTNRKSQSCSVSYEVKNESSSSPDVGENVFISRWYRTSARCE